MKDYKEMAESVLQKRDAYVIHRKKQIRMYTELASGLAACLLVGFVGWSIYQRNFAYHGQDMGTGSAVLRSTNGYQAAEAYREEAQEEAAYTTNDAFSEIATIAEHTESEAVREQEDKEVISAGKEILLEEGIIEEASEKWSVSPEIFGGSFVDAEGNTVILLTENSLQNQETFLAQNAIIAEATYFSDCKYSLTHLYGLVSDLWEKLEEYNEDQFLENIEVCIEYNMVRVTVNSDNPELLAHLKEVDSTGDALSILYHMDEGSLVLE